MRRTLLDLANCRYEYRQRPCLICGGSPTCYAHWPKHRGMGGKNAGWAYNEGVPLCFRCHERLDARGETWAKHLETIKLVEELAPQFWGRVRREAG